MLTVTKTDLPPLSKYLYYLKKIWKSQWVTNDGELTQLLEVKLKEFLGVHHLIAVSNGTAALQLALKAHELQGEIITTPFTFVATTNVILWEGLTPIFADINPKTFNIDPNDVEKKITEKTSAILATHVYGSPCAVDELQAVADRHNLKLIYDGAHAFGVKLNDRSVFSYGDISILSFHATKVFQSIEGGALISNDAKIIETLKLLRNHGIKSEEEICLPGINAKMNEFQAAMGLCNLEKFNQKIRQREKKYHYYKKQLHKLPVKFQEITASQYNYSYMPVCFDLPHTRNNVYNNLRRLDIYSRKYFYPLTCNLEYVKNVAGERSPDKLPVASDIAERILCLPLYPGLKKSEINNVIKIIRNTCE